MANYSKDRPWTVEGREKSKHKTKKIKSDLVYELISKSLNIDEKIVKDIFDEYSKIIDSVLENFGEEEIAIYLPNLGYFMIRERVISAHRHAFYNIQKHEIQEWDIEQKEILTLNFSMFAQTKNKFKEVHERIKNKNKNNATLKEKLGDNDNSR